jgi:hypothetical protein
MPSVTAKTTKTILAISLVGLFACAGTAAARFDDPSTWPKKSEYSGKISQCLDTPQNQRNSIQDFVCPSGAAAGNIMDTAYQVVIDVAFRKIDKEAESWIKTLRDSGGSRIGEIGAAINGKFGQGGEFEKRYKAFCQGQALKEGIAHFGEVSTEGDVGQYVASSEVSRCEGLVNQKMEAFKYTAWIVAGKSVVQAYKEGKHTFINDTKNAYDRLANKFMLAIGQMATVRDKMPNKTKKVVK